MSDPEFQRRLLKAALNNPANSDIYTVEMAQFVATFERVAMPPQFKHLFFVQGGTLAVENALKAAMDWKVRLNFQKGLNQEKGKKVLHFKEAFHGRGGYTTSLTNTADPNKYKYFALFDKWPRVSNPKIRFPLEGENLAQAIRDEEQSISEILHHLETDGDDICCILLEPVQGEGGDNHFRPEFWQKLRQIADKYDILLIADEVQSGMGLTGKFWAHQYYNVVPDIIVFGKKSQVCGFMATDRVDRVKENVFVVPSRINSTWGGNLVDMVRSRQFLEIIEEDNLVENATKVGAYLLQQLQGLQREFPHLINNVRGKGLLCSFDTSTPEVASKLKAFAYDNNMLIISCGTQTIRFRPVLDVQKDHFEVAIRILRNGLAKIGAKKAAL